jgi:tRNA (guanine26-N2/guanine27-N2)-dimethyltransferase
MDRLIEGAASFLAPRGKITRELPVFYNPAMELNRTIEVLLLAALGRKRLRIADPLAGTGVRSVRILKELPRGTIRELRVNDISPAAVKLIRKNLALNRLAGKAEVSCMPAQKMLFEAGMGLDLIDIDPFGSPAPFLDPAVQRLNHAGILAVTATDTAALAGVAPAACERKYWAQPIRSPMMHETGMRILIRKCQLAASQHGKALTPLFCHATQHYYRAYLRCEKSESKAGRMFQQHQWFLYCRQCLAWGVGAENAGACCGKPMAAGGPLWTGQLWDSALAGKMAKRAEDGEARHLLATIADESRVAAVGFPAIHTLCQQLRTNVPSFDGLMAAIRKAGHAASRTHFAPDGIRTTMPLDAVKKLLAHSPP